MLPKFTAPQCYFTAPQCDFTAPQRDFTEFTPLWFTISGAGCVAAGLVASAALVAAGGLIVYVPE